MRKSIVIVIKHNRIKMEKIEKRYSISLSDNFNSKLHETEADLENLQEGNMIVLLGDSEIILTSFGNPYKFYEIEIYDHKMKPFFLKSSYFSCNDWFFSQRWYNPINKYRFDYGYSTGFEALMSDSSGTNRKLNLRGSVSGIKAMLSILQFSTENDIRTWREYDLAKKIQFEQKKLEIIKEPLAEISYLINTKQIDLNLIEEDLKEIERIYSQYDLSDFEKYIYDGYDFRMPIGYHQYSVKSANRAKYYAEKASHE